MVDVVSLIDTGMHCMPDQYSIPQYTRLLHIDIHEMPATVDGNVIHQTSNERPSTALPRLDHMDIHEMSAITDDDIIDETTEEHLNTTISGPCLIDIHGSPDSDERDSPVEVSGSDNSGFAVPQSKRSTQNLYQLFHRLTFLVFLTPLSNLIDRRYRLQINMRKPWKKTQSSHMPLVHGVIIMVISVALILWRSVHRGDFSGRFSAAQFVVQVGAFIVALGS